MNQKGYVIKIVLVVFAILIGLLIFPFKAPSPNEAGVSTGCLAGQAPAQEHLIRLPEPTFDDAKYYPDTEEYIYWGQPNQNQIEEYVLIRTNVLTPQQVETPNWSVFGTNPLSGLAHSIPVGENPEKPGYMLYYPTSPNAFSKRDGIDAYMKNEEMVMFRNEDPSSIREINGITYYSVDVYQKKTKFDDPNKGYETEDLFPCDEEAPHQESTTSVVVPAQSLASPNDQLQLEWFVFQQGGGGVWTAHCKPAVYLYPKRKQLVNVKVNPLGELSYTDPPYDKQKGWTVEAYPDGQLLTMNDERLTNNYLYYESKILDSVIKKPSKGWSVRKDGMESLFNRVLPKLGLNAKEANDFKEYWLKQLPESQYYFVGLMEKDQRDYLEALQVTPAPETSIRFSFFFEPLDQLIDVAEPVIETPSRNGFTLVDWGGMIKLHKDTPFTCSQ